jgi:hypothetical protein
LSYYLKLNYSNAKEAVVKNNLEMDINALVKFNLPKNDYQVDNGTIILQWEDDDSVELYVSVLVSQNSSIAVKFTLENSGKINN